jgi:DNA-binding response OmpR family regulator
MLMRLLLVEDHPGLGPDIKKGLEDCLYAVDLTTNGADAVELGVLIPYDLIILDILLPGMNGWDVCRHLREKHCQIPILFLTALSDVDDRVRGLNLGGDDYLSKPFAFRELEARVRALLRRENSSRSPVLQFLDLTLDPLTYEARRGNRLITLSNKEYVLLEFLLRHPRQIMSRMMITEHVWDEDAEHLSNVIDVYIRHLRQKLCAEGEPNIIHTIRHAGYQLKEPV